ncbi:MAG: MFS transporter [Chloroflexales bacterium]|nr:MFS transporter [Chloroflexales bacterium]
MRLPRFTGMSAFWLTWLGLLLSFTGSSLTRFGLSVWVFEQTRDPEAYSAILFFATIPLAFGSLVAGPLVDRWNRRQVLIVGNIVASLPTLVIMLLFFVNQLAIWHLYVALFINGLANAFILPAFDASIRMLVPKEQLGRASGMSQMIQSLGTIIAPPIAGFMLVQFGLGSVFIVDYLTVTAAVLALTVVFIPQPGDGEKPVSSVWQDFVFGLRYITERSPFVFLMVFLTLVIFTQSFVYALSGPVVLAFGDEATLGLVYGAFGIGGLFGAVLVGITGGAKRRMNGVLLGTMGMAIGAILCSLRPDILWTGGGVFLFGLSMMYMISLNRTIYQEKAAPEVLGRIFAFRVAIGVGAQAVGLLLSGWLAANVFEPAMQAGGDLAATFGGLLDTGEGRGAALLILITGVVLLVVTVIAALLPALRNLEDHLPDYVAPEQPDPQVPEGGTIAVPR